MTLFCQIKCRVCRLKGHYQSHCPVADSSGNTIGSGSSGSASTKTTGSSSRTETAGADTAASLAASTQEVSTISSGILLNQNSETYINPQWVLLDSESMDHIFYNKDLLTEVYPTSNGESLRLHTSADDVFMFLLPAKSILIHGPYCRYICDMGCFFRYFNNILAYHGSVTSGGTYVPAITCCTMGVLSNMLNCWYKGFVINGILEHWASQADTKRWSSIYICVYIYIEKVSD